VPPYLLLFAIVLAGIGVHVVMLAGLVALVKVDLAKRLGGK